MDPVDAWLFGFVCGMVVTVGTALAALLFTLKGSGKPPTPRPPAG